MLLSAALNIAINIFIGLGAAFTLGSLLHSCKGFFALWHRLDAEAAAVQQQSGVVVVQHESLVADRPVRQAPAWAC